MRRPIRSHVANRRMFQGGGLSPLPYPRANRPTGILASSQPLVDTIVQNAVNPAGNVMMNQGGFAHGGWHLSDLWEKRRPDKAEEPHDYPRELGDLYSLPVATGADRSKGRFNASPDYSWVDVGQVEDFSFPSLGFTIEADKPARPGAPINFHSWVRESGANTANRLFPMSERNLLPTVVYDKATGARFAGRGTMREYETLYGKEIKSVAKENFFRILTNISGPMTEAVARGGNILGTAWEWLTEIEDARINKYTFPQMLTINDMLRGQPNYAEDIREETLRLISADSEISPQDLKEGVARHLKKTYEAQDPLVKQNLTVAGASLLDPIPYGKLDSETLMEEKSPEELALSAEAILKEIEPGPNVKDVAFTNDFDTVYNQWKNTGFSTDFIFKLRDGGRYSKDFVEAIVARKGEDTEGLTTAPELVTPEPPTSPPTMVELEPVEKPIKPGKGYTSSADEIKALNERNEKLSEKQELSKEEQKNALETVIETAAVQINRGDKQETIDATFDKFVNEFIDKMPEFQGKTDYEKGWDYIMLGAAMAAGDSPDPITNISKAILATGERFTEDDKGARAYKNNIQMAGAKYALEKLNTLEARRHQTDTTFEWLYATEDISAKDSPTGNEIKKGTMNMFSITQLMDMGSDMPNNLLPKDFALGQIKAFAASEVAYVDNLRDMVKNRTLSRTEETKAGKDYHENLESYRSAVHGELYLTRALAAVTTQTSDILGATGAISYALDKAKNFFGFGRIPDDPEGTQSLAGKSYDKSVFDRNSSARALFETDIKIAFQKLIPSALQGVQSANSISNRDVQFLADAFIDSGLLDKEGNILALTTTNLESLVKRLQGAVTIFKEQQETSIKAAIGEWDALGGRLVPRFSEKGKMISGSAREIVPEYALDKETGMPLFSQYQVRLGETAVKKMILADDGIWDMK